MIEEQHFDVYPLGWENDPEVERFRLSKFDYFSNCAYSQYAILFRLTDADKPKVATVLQKGLERTLSRARHFCGDIEKDPKGGYSIVKRRKSAVCLFIYWYDAPGDTKKHPSFDDLAESNFSTVALSCLNVFTRISMRHRIIPDARPDYRARRVVSAFKAHFIRGGLMLDMFVHHYASDAVGWAGFAHQLAQNCYAIMDNTAFPTWDPAWLDVSRFIKEELPEDSRVGADPPPESLHHSKQTPTVSLSFHLPKSKGAELKKLATPTDGSWISTYDAFSAKSIIPPHLARNRRHSQTHQPRTDPRTQRNLVFTSPSNAARAVHPTVAEIVSD